MAAALRTQIYLTREQREELDRIGDREGVSLAELIRAAVDEYLEGRPHGIDDALAESFGTVPDATAPSRSEWDRREPAGRG